jgi:AcrR family transcriptional regulator
VAARKKAKRTPLNRGAVVEAALDLVDREGLQQLTMRRLGEQLKIEAMSLYHHFPSKNHLLDACVDAVIENMDRYRDEQDWRDGLRAAACAVRAGAHVHPGIFPYVAVHRLNTERGLVFLDRVLAIFEAGGFDPYVSARLFRSFTYYLIGAALDETAGYANGPSAVEPLSPSEEARRFPRIDPAGQIFN